MKAIALMKRKSGMSHEDFQRHLLDEHVPFMRAIPGLQRWVVNLAANGEAPPVYDAVTEFWFRDEQALKHALTSPEVARALQDGEQFVAPPGPVLIVANEHVVIGPDASGGADR